MTEAPDTPRKTRGRANAIDAVVGATVRTRRTLLGFSQERLGNALGLTFQQIQKYERGANRMGASRLVQTADALGCTVADLFEAVPGHGPGAPASDTALHRREILEVVRAYVHIGDPKVRKRVFELTKTLGKSGGAETPYAVAAE